MSTYCKELSSIAREVRTDAVVTGVVGYSDPMALPAVVSALWDTGAWSSVITQKVVTALGLSPIDHVRACGVNGWYDAPVYIVDVMLPNKIKISNLLVSLGTMTAADMLIGMDVISMGDFKLINDGKTSFSIRTPSEGDAPFVADTTTEATR